jgi:phosphoglycerate dehydrogenase-like enzyme
MSISTSQGFSAPREADLSIAGEFFNLFNRTDYLNPTNSFTTSAFGKILTAASAREIQFAGKIIFRYAPILSSISPAFLQGHTGEVQPLVAGGSKELRHFMDYKVGYFLRAGESVYGVIRGALPEDTRLVTLAGKDPQEEIAAIGDLDFLIAAKATTAMIGAAQKLRLLQLPGVGYDQVNLEAAARKGIPVAVSVSGSSDAVAEHAMLLMLAVSRRLVEIANSLRSGKWWMWERRTVSYGLAGKTLGIIGFGRIGKEVAVRAAAFGMSIQYYDVVRVEGHRYCPLNELLQTSDVVTLHCPLTAETRGLLDRTRIGLMKPKAILINTARGGIIDESALHQALVEGRLAGAGLDVFAEEPPDTACPLLHLDQVIATPHISTGTLDSLQTKAAFYAENIRRVLAGEQPEGLLNQTAVAP